MRPASQKTSTSSQASAKGPTNKTNEQTSNKRTNKGTERQRERQRDLFCAVLVLHRTKQKTKNFTPSHISHYDTHTIDTVLHLMIKCDPILFGRLLTTTS